MIADVATHEATCAHAICEKGVAPLKQENLKLRHKLAEAVSTITKTLEPDLKARGGLTREQIEEQLMEAEDRNPSKSCK